MNTANNVIYGINGPVVTVRGSVDFAVGEMVFVSDERLVGEVISISRMATTIQVYEVTTGLKPGMPVYPTGGPMNVVLGPGLMSGIFDGICRPLRRLEETSGAFIARGSLFAPLDEEKIWEADVKVAVGDALSPGQIYATVHETDAIEHRCMVPPGLSGSITACNGSGSYRVNDPVAVLTDAQGKEHILTLCQKWPIRQPRPVARWLACDIPLITGQRVIDTLLPIAKGGTAAIPGGFGTGKTMTQHQLAKWCDADLIIYVGCGERGNEMTQVLDEFGELIDPRSGKKLTDRTILIANTSNMPVAAREASIYTGITLAEYYRDMGYAVAMMADSTSRWAEALREISGRLEEMPAEEGFPAYLPSRLSQFYERAGRTETLCGNEGSITIIGAVSPQGADFSEPVTQNTKRFTRVFWALDKSLAYARHYPAIDWNQSYSEYDTDLARYYEENVDTAFMALRTELMQILREETSLLEIVKLIGADVLPDDQKLVIETAHAIRVGFLQQNAYHADDTYVPLQKQYKMMKCILHLHKRARDVIDQSIPLNRVSARGLFDKLMRMKYDVPNNNLIELDRYLLEIDQTVEEIIASSQERRGEVIG